MTDVERPAAGPNIAANRAARKWTRRELIGRGLWEIMRIPLFAWTPRPFWGVRRAVLRMFGATIGRQAHVHPTVRIAVPWNLRIADYASLGDRVVVYNLGAVSIGHGATVSQHAHLCAGSHDYRRSDLPLVKAEITVGDGVWVCADAFVGPGVSIGDYAIVGARAVAVRDVEAWSIVGGNPARVIGRRPPLVS